LQGNEQGYDGEIEEIEDLRWMNMGQLLLQSELRLDLMTYREFVLRLNMFKLMFLDENFDKHKRCIETVELCLIQLLMWLIPLIDAVCVVSMVKGFKCCDCQMKS
jgi:hypothetical protein